MKTAPAFILATVVAALPLRLDAQPSACTPHANSQGNRVDEAGFVPLGGIEQWVTVRGDDRDNPILLHVHGGPGIALSAFVAEFAPFDKAYTSVQWDQRGSGCTFGRYRDAPLDVTLDRLALDGVELAEYLHQRFAGRELIVLGHSFGTIVATEMVRRAPEQFAAYVGTGQFTSTRAHVEEQLAQLRVLATRNGDAQLAAELSRIGTLDSNSPARFGAVNRLLGPHMPPADGAFIQGLEARAAQAMTSAEIADWRNGRGASVGRLLPEVQRVDFLASVDRLEVPFVLIQGSADLITPTAPAITYFNRVQAPAKGLVVIDGAGHFPFITYTAEFLAALNRTARPLALR